MFFEDYPNLDLLMRTVILGPLGLLWVVLMVRVVGLRSFSKMTAFDFVTTVAIGSLLANAAVTTEWAAFIQSCGAISAILALQVAIAYFRRSAPVASQSLENEPVILMRDGKWNEAEMEEARVSYDDVWAKLREANVLSLKEVRAVVLETTGDISVLHGKNLDAELLTGVES